MGKDRVREVLGDIIMNKLNNVLEITISDTKEQIKYIDIAEDYNISELTDRIMAISMEYNVDKKDIRINSISEVGSYENENSSSLCASFKMNIKKTEKEMGDELKAKVSSHAYQIVREEMIANEFSRIGFSSNYLKPFEDTSVLEMIKSEDYSRLIDYYSLFFNEKWDNYFKLKEKNV